MTENNSWSLKIFNDQCCDNCYMKIEKSESQKISENDAMGREKFWQDLGRP
jgi:predicted  nucleic acid-binding Zn-ribbon protein